MCGLCVCECVCECEWMCGLCVRPSFRRAENDRLQKQIAALTTARDSSAGSTDSAAIEFLKEELRVANSVKENAVGVRVVRHHLRFDCVPCLYHSGLGDTVYVVCYS